MRIAYGQITTALADALAARGFERVQPPLTHIEEPRPWGVASSVCFSLAPRAAEARIAEATAGQDKGAAKKLAAEITKETGSALAAELAGEMQKCADAGSFPFIHKVEAEGAYINFYYDCTPLSHTIVDLVNDMGADFGQGVCVGAELASHYPAYCNAPRRIMVEYAQPNTHKDFHVGHLRNASIGQAIANLLEFQGNQVYKATYLGDVGAHVAKAICGMSMSQEIHAQDPGFFANIPAMTQPLLYWGYMYKEYNRWLEHLNASGAGGKYAQAISTWMQGWEEHQRFEREEWAISREECLREFREIFTELLVDFTSNPDCWFYESTVDDTQLGQKTAAELKQRDIATVDESEKYKGSLFVDFEAHVARLLPAEIAAKEAARGRALNDAERAETEAALLKTLRRLGKMVILRSDGTSLYQTKELGLAKHKFDLIHEQTGEALDESLYVVGAEQKLYFEQVFTILRLWGFPNADHCKHISYELVVLPEGKMSSREGTVVSYRELRDESVKRAEAVIREKGIISDQAAITQTAHAVAIAAIKYTMLQVGGSQQIVFDFEQALSFDGRAAPYLQYAYARAGKLVGDMADSHGQMASAKSRLQVLEPAADAASGTSATSHLPSAIELHPSEVALVRLMSSFPSMCQSAAERYEPAVVCNYLYSLADAFSGFYRDCRVLDAPEPERSFRQGLCRAFRTVIATGFRLLALPLPEAM